MFKKYKQKRISERGISNWRGYFLKLLDEYKEEPRAKDGESKKGNY